MRFEVESHLGAVKRSVSSLERDGRPSRSVTLSRIYAATMKDLWDSLTNPDRIPRWFLPVTGELDLGGSYQLEGNAGGMITECERPSHFALTWEFGEDVSWVEVGISDGGDGPARLTVTHTSHLSEHWDEYGPGAVGVGWELTLLGLALHLARPNEPKPDEAAFAASSDSRTFIAGSSEGWKQAAVAAGTDPDAAAAAARRTASFYSGDSPETA